MGGSSSSSNTTTQQAVDNRTFIDDRDTTNIDRRVYNTIDDRDDNRVFNDNRQDNSVKNTYFQTIDDRDDNRVFNDYRQDNSVKDSFNTINNIDRRVFNTIDDRDDNRTFIDKRQDNRSWTTVDESVGEGAIVARDNSSITINETDGGAVQQSLEFAAASQGLTFGALASLLDKQQTENNAFLQAVYNNSEAGEDDSRNKLVYASLFAGVSMAALIAFRKGF